MAQKWVLVDKAELVLMFRRGKKLASLNLTSDSIVRIQFDKCKERKFGIIPTDSEKITIVTPKSGEPIVYWKGKSKAFFEEYKADLAKFAKDYRITFTDNTI